MIKPKLNLLNKSTQSQQVPEFIERKNEEEKRLCLMISFNTSKYTDNEFREYININSAVVQIGSNTR